LRLREKNFDRHVETYNSPVTTDQYFGFLYNYIPVYPNTYALKTQVHPRSGNDRPLIELERTDIFGKFSKPFDRLIPRFLLITTKASLFKRLKNLQRGFCTSSRAVHHLRQLVYKGWQSKVDTSKAFGDLQ
jgi:hypothetical protein